MPKKFTVPLASPYNTRVAATNPVSPTSGIWGLGVWGVFIWGNTTQSTEKDARYINCFKSTVGNRVYIVKRPGFGTGFTPWAGNVGAALLAWTGSASGADLISAFGATNSVIYNGNTSLGAITGRCTGLTESVVGANVATVAITSSDQTGWYYDVVTAVPTKITDAQFPGNASKTLAGTFSHLKGFACVLTADGLLYAGDINTMTGWTSNSFDSVNTSPSKGVASVTHKEFVIAFKRDLMEFWYDAGLTPFPLARANAKTVKVGLVNADAVAQISDTIWFAGSTPQGGLSIFQYDGASPQRVSPPAIDATMILAGASNISLSTIRNYGYSFVYVKAGSTTFAYCVEEKFWFEVLGEVPLWYKVVGVSQGGTMVNYAISNISTSGKVYVQNHAALTFEDDGATYTARGQTANEDQGTNKRKFYSYIDVVGDVELSTSPLTILKSDDDFQTFDTLGTVDLSEQRKRLTRLGAAEQRSWAFVHSANTPMRLLRIEGECEFGN